MDFDLDNPQTSEQFFIHLFNPIFHYIRLEQEQDDLFPSDPLPIWQRNMNFDSNV